MKDCLIPDENRLSKSKDFETGTGQVLAASRIIIAWCAVGMAAGAYEAALKYVLNRIQFKKPIAQF